MKIGIGLKEKSYTPEAFAYSEYLKKKGWIVHLAPEDALDKNLDIHIYFMGTRPFWKNNEFDLPFVIHEYSSLSMPPYAKTKDIVKRIVNKKPTGRIFLNSLVKKNMGFKDKIPFIFRDMGVDKDIFMPSPKNPEFDLIYCGSIAGRLGLIDELYRLGIIGFKILVVGLVEKNVQDHFKFLPNIFFSGRVERHELPHIYQQARAGLNYTPNIYPFNIQTSTKTIEYCAAGLGLVSNKYEWIDDFSKSRNFAPFWLHNIKNKDIFDRHIFEIPNVNCFEWNFILNEVKFDIYLSEIINKCSC
jgi:hypothetical protein